MIGVYASEPHYRDNVMPVWRALPDDLQGDGNTVIVSSYNDMRAMRGHDIIFMEHGSGQTYGSGLASYAGAEQREGVVLFLCPNVRVADLNLATHPDIPSVVVGTPKMDPWWGTQGEDGVVGLAWHWDAMVVPETRTAFPHYASVLEDLRGEFEVIGTAHPRIADIIRPFYKQAGIPFVSSDELYRRASVLVCDNTSLGWEFVALNRPVVWCNAPWYRKFVEHGMRFWEYADSGIQVDEPEDLVGAVFDAMHHDGLGARRAEIADLLYIYRDGTASRRAAAAIVEEIV